MGMGAFRKLVRREVRKASGNRVEHRIRMLEQSLAAATTTTKSLLTCDDDPDYDKTSDGTNVAECHPNSRILAFQLVMGLYVASNPISNGPMEFLMYRDRDAAISGASAGNMSTLYTADFSTTTGMLRKNTYLAGHQFITTNYEQKTVRLSVSRKALRRAGIMHDGDLIRLAFDNPDPDTACMLYLRGRIITKTP